MWETDVLPDFPMAKIYLDNASFGLMEISQFTEAPGCPTGSTCACLPSANSGSSIKHTLPVGGQKQVESRDLTTEDYSSLQQTVWRPWQFVSLQALLMQTDLNNILPMIHCGVAVILHFSFRVVFLSHFFSRFSLKTKLKGTFQSTRLILLSSCTEFPWGGKKAAKLSTGKGKTKLSAPIMLIRNLSAGREEKLSGINRGEKKLFYYLYLSECTWHLALQGPCCQ